MHPERVCLLRTALGSLSTQDKVDVNGPAAHPVYKFLKAETNTNKVPWNYWKALVDRSGKAIKSFGPSVDPLSFEGDVRGLLPLCGLLTDLCTELHRAGPP